MIQPRSLRRAIAGFGMDTVTLTGPLEDKLDAIQRAGFGQVMLKADDLAGYPGGWERGVRAVEASGLRPTGFQVLRDFEGLDGHLHQYKIDVARMMLEMAAALGAPVLLVCSSTSTHASEDLDHIARDLRKLAMLAVPLGVRIAYEGLSWGRTVNEYTTAWDVVRRADHPNLGVGLDSFHMLAAGTPLDTVDEIDPDRIFLVQLSDFLWREAPTFEDRRTTARTYRVFPGEGVHTEQLIDLVTRLDNGGYAGDYSFEVFNQDYVQLPLAFVADRASRSALWLGTEVLAPPGLGGPPRQSSAAVESGIESGVGIGSTVPTSIIRQTGRVATSRSSSGVATGNSKNSR